VFFFFGVCGVVFFFFFFFFCVGMVFFFFGFWGGFFLWFLGGCFLNSSVTVNFFRCKQNQLYMKLVPECLYYSPAEGGA